MQEQAVANVRWGEWIGEGWQMFVEKWRVWVVQMLVVFVAFAIPVVPFYLVLVTSQLAAAEGGAPPEMPPLFLPLMLIIVVVSLFGGAFFWSGLYKTAFKQLRGEAVSIGDLFSGGDIFLRVLGAFFAIGILAMLGAILCIFPAFIVAGLVWFTIPLIVDRNLSIGEALTTSYEMTKGNWFMFTLFAFVVSLLAGMGQFACYVGLLVTYPLQFTITTIAYRDVFGVAGARSFASNKPEYPTNYAPPSFPPPTPQFAPSPQPEPTTSICSNCGTTIQRAARFCSKCGSPINAA